MTKFEHDDRDDRINAYLWDPTASPAPEVEDLERRLEPLRFDRSQTPLVWAARPAARSRNRWLYGLAAAAAVLVALGWVAVQWRLSWPAGQAWIVDSSAGMVPPRLSVGSALTLTAADRANVRIARIGSMWIVGDARMTLQSTQGTRHRLTLERGTVRVRTWAPPGSVVFRTPAGEVIDLGCEFDLVADADRSIVRVRSGWVQLENGVAETLAPEGTTSEMRPGRPPTVPVYEDADSRFIQAVRALEDQDRTDRTDSVATIVSLARKRDVLTLLLLVARQTPGSVEIAARAAELFPPPDGVTANGVVRGDRDGLWRWRDTLPLPAPKNWIRNWRDALPVWLVGGEELPRR